MFRYLVLGLLRDGQAYHGYALMKAYRERSGVSISTGNFYRELQRLVGEGWVQTAAIAPGEDARRAPYQITEDGLAAFEAWFVSPPTHIGSYDDELSSRAVFIGNADPGVAIRLLDQWREFIWIQGKTLERDREAALLKAAATAGNRYDPRSLLLARRLKHVAADLEFIDELRAACALPPPELQQEEMSEESPPAAVEGRPKRKVAGPRITERQRSKSPKTGKSKSVASAAKVAKVAKATTQKTKKRGGRTPLKPKPARAGKKK